MLAVSRICHSDHRKGGASRVPCALDPESLSATVREGEAGQAPARFFSHEGTSLKRPMAERHPPPLASSPRSDFRICSSRPSGSVPQRAGLLTGTAASFTGAGSEVRSRSRSCDRSGESRTRRGAVCLSGVKNRVLAQPTSHESPSRTNFRCTNGCGGRQRPWVKGNNEPPLGTARSGNGGHPPIKRSDFSAPPGDPLGANVNIRQSRRQ